MTLLRIAYIDIVVVTAEISSKLLQVELRDLIILYVYTWRIGEGEFLSGRGMATHHLQAQLAS